MGSKKMEFFLGHAYKVADALNQMAILYNSLSEEEIELINEQYQNHLNNLKSMDEQAADVINFIEGLSEKVRGE